jgi:ribose transport system substrate-binding protein
MPSQAHNRGNLTMGWGNLRRCAIWLAACSALAATASPDDLRAAERKPRISLVLGATGTEFAGEQRAGAMAALRDLKGAVQLKVAGPAQIDPGQEVRIFQSEAATLPDAIIVAPIPPSLFTEPALRAQQQGIALVYLMSPPRSDVKNVLFVGQREYDMGRTVAGLIADRVAAKSGGKAAADITGMMVPGSCVPGMENLDDRMLGVHTELKQRLPKVTVLADMNTGNERGNSFSLWQQAVQARPNALAFIGACENDFSNLAKVKEDDRRNFEIVAFDTPETVRNSIKRGTIAAAVPPSHFASAYMAVWVTGNALLKKQKVPTGWLQTPITVIDARNVDVFNKASLPAANLESFYKKDIDALKTRDVTRLPATAQSRAPGRS